MAKKIEVIAEIVPGGEGFPVVSGENVKVGNKTLDQFAEETTVKMPSIKVSATQPAEKNCLWIEPIN